MKRRPLLIWSLPDAYRRLPDMIDSAFADEDSDFQVDVRLDKRETYSNVQIDRVPGVSGWISVQRGCDKFCICIVPFVRGRERSFLPKRLFSKLMRCREKGLGSDPSWANVSNYYEKDTISPIYCVKFMRWMAFSAYATHLHTQ